MAQPFGTDTLDQWRGPKATRAGGSSPGVYAQITTGIICDLQPPPDSVMSPLFQHEVLDASGEFQFLILPSSIALVTDDDVFWHVADGRAWEVARPPKRFKDPSTGQIDHWEVIVRAMNPNRTPSEIKAAYGP